MQKTQLKIERGECNFTIQVGFEQLLKTVLSLLLPQGRRVQKYNDRRGAHSLGQSHTMERLRCFACEALWIKQFSIRLQSVK